MRILLPVLLLVASAGFSQTSKPFTEPEAKQFDFWVGDWNLTWPGAKAGETDHGTNSVRRVLDACVVEENFSGESAMHLRGRSFSVYIARARQWKQTWVDNEGGYLDFTGAFADGKMVLSREALSPDGARFLQRMVFKNIAADEFDWNWENSKDDGKTWQVVWPIHYRRKK